MITFDKLQKDLNWKSAKMFSYGEILWCDRFYLENLLTEIFFLPRSATLSIYQEADWENGLHNPLKRFMRVRIEWNDRTIKILAKVVAAGPFHHQCDWNADRREISLCAQTMQKIILSSKSSLLKKKVLRFESFEIILTFYYSKLR